MAQQEKPARRLTAADFKKVEEWVKSEDGKRTLRESQKRITEGVAKEIARYSIVDPAILKEPYTL
ncbi:MAG: hypothetical protein WAT74_02530 [Flavobacteriales bacterium]